jgi:DNA-binding beta-propeller fold protein YncE
VTVSTVAGGLAAGHRDGPAGSALFDGPAAVAVGDDGSIYVADSRNHCVRLVSPEGEVTTLAGMAGEAGFIDGPARQARFLAPSGLALAPDGSLLVADTGNHRIRRVTRAGAVTTLAGSETLLDDLGRPLGGRRDGAASLAQFRYPAGLAVDGQGTVYVADAGNHRVCRISSAGEVTTVPTLGDEGIDTPTHLAVAPDGRLWVVDTGRNVLWVGAGRGPLARWGPAEADGGPSSPSGAVVVGEADASHAVYVLGYDDNCLWRLAGDAIALVAGEGSPGSADWVDGPGNAARFSRPAGLAHGPTGDLYVADLGNNCVRRVWMNGGAEEAR